MTLTSHLSGAVNTLLLFGRLSRKPMRIKKLWLDNLLLKQKHRYLKIFAVMILRLRFLGKNLKTYFFFHYNPKMDHDSVESILQ